MKGFGDTLYYISSLILAIYGAIFFEVNSYIKGKWQFLFILCYFEFMLLLLRYFLKRTRCTVKRAQYGICFLLACITAFLLLDRMEIDFPRESTTVVIEATGERNGDSKGNEVWLGDILIDGESVDLETIWHDSAWIYKPDIAYLVATPGEQASSIQFSCSRARKIEIEFQTSEYSGIVEIRSDEGGERLDLYGTGAEMEQYKIEIPAETTLFWQGYSYLAAVILFTIIYVVLAVYLNRKKMKELHRS